MNIIKQNLKWLYERVISPFYHRDKNLWVFGEWFGKRCCDNSLYFANFIVGNHPNIQVVWISEKGADLSLLSPGVRRVEIETAEAVELLKHAGVVVYNQSLADFSSYMSMYCMGAVTINLWHGVPWKKIGVDAFSRHNKLRWFYANYILRLQRPTAYLALSENFADIMQHAYLAKGKGIIKAGYPRNSIFYDDKAIASARNKVEQLLIDVNNSNITSNTKIITYMPTFRDRYSDVFSFEQLSDNEQLINILQEHDAVIVQKAHFVNSEKKTGKANLDDPRIYNMNDIAAAELLAASDILVTDYSSCFFDYLLLDRPIIHYIYDYEYYANKDRGLYYKKEDVVCGDAPETVNELLKSIEANLVYPDKDTQLRQQRRKCYMTYESAESCKDIFDAICELQK